MILSNDSGERKKAAIALIDTGSYGAGDLVFALDGADSGELHLTNDERLRITSGGQVQVKASTQSTTTSSGALIVTGGIGVAKNIICGGALEVQNNTLTVTSGAPNIMMAVPSGGLDSRIYNDGNGNFIIGHGVNSNTPTERLRISSGGDLKTTEPSNVSYTTASDGSSNHNLVYKLEGTIQGNGASGYYNMRAWRAHKTGTVRMQAYMFIVSGPYYFNFRVYDVTAGSVVFNAADGGGYNFYDYPTNQSGNVHNRKQYSWPVDVIAGHNYQVQMIPSNYSGSTTYNDGSQGLYFDSFRVYSDSPGLSYPYSQIQIAQDWGHSGVDTTYDTMQQGYNTGTLNLLEEFRGMGDTLIGHFNHRAYGQYAFYEFDISSNSYMFYVRAVGYLYGLGYINAMKGGYMYTNNSVINIKGGEMSNSRAIYNLSRASGTGRLVVTIDSGGTGYTEGNYALFFGNFGPSNPPRLTRYRRQNSSTSPF